MGAAQVANKSFEARVLEWTSRGLRRRAPAAWASAAFVFAGLIYFLWWGGHVGWPSPRHGNWNTSSDSWLTFQAANEIAHGHLDRHGPKILWRTGGEPVADECH